MTDTNNTTNQQEEFSFIEWLKLLLGLNTENDEKKVYDKAAECYNKYVAGDGEKNQITGEELKDDKSKQNTVKEGFEEKLKDKKVKNSLLFEKAINLMRTAGGQEATEKELLLAEKIETAQKDIDAYNEITKKKGKTPEDLILDYKNKISELKKEKDNLENKRLAGQAEYDNTNKKIESCNSKIKKNGDKITNLENENKKLNEQFNEIRKELHEKYKISEDYIEKLAINDPSYAKIVTKEDFDLFLKIGGEDIFNTKIEKMSEIFKNIKNNNENIEEYKPELNDNKKLLIEESKKLKNLKNEIDKTKLDENSKKKEIDNYSKNIKDLKTIIDKKKQAEEEIKKSENDLKPIQNKVNYSKALNEFKQSVGTKEYSTHMKAMETAYNLGIDPKKALKTVENYKPRALSKEWFRERKEKKKLDRLKKIESETCCGNYNSVFTKLQEKCDKEMPFRIFGRKKEKKAISDMCLAVATGYEEWLKGEGKGKSSIEQNKKIIDLFHEYIENPKNEKFKVGLISKKFIKNLETRLNKDQKKLEMADKSYRERCDKNAKLNKADVAKKYGKDSYKEAKEELKNKKEKEARKSKENIKQTKQNIKKLKKDIKQLENLKGNFKGNLEETQKIRQNIALKENELEKKKKNLTSLKEQHNNNLQKFNERSEGIKRDREKFKENAKDIRKELKKNEELNKSSNIYKSFKKDKGAKENIKTEAGKYSDNVQKKRDSNTKSTKSTLESLNIIKPTKKDVNTNTVNSSSIPTSKSKATEMVKNAPTSIV